jgi:hypothetical protein
MDARRRDLAGVTDLYSDVVYEKAKEILQEIPV